MDAPRVSGGHVERGIDFSLGQVCVAAQSSLLSRAFFFMWIQFISPNQRTRCTMYFTSSAQHISYTEIEESTKVKIPLAYV